MKTLLFLRHGKTAYTGQFPDLTDEGKREISDAADHIAEIVGNKTFVQIVSSSAPRALGSADIINKRLGMQSVIEEEPAIRCMDFYDSEKAKAIWASFPNARAVDCAYATDSQFEEGTVIEKRSAIQHRFFNYLSTLFERFAANKSHDVSIYVSHYEVLWSLVKATIPTQEPLIHGELIELNLDRPGVIVRFRGYREEFDYGVLVNLFAGRFKV